MLIGFKGVSAFMIEQSNCPSKYMNRLLYRDGLEVTIVTHYPEQAKYNWAEVEKRYVPPFTRVWNVDTEVTRLWARYLRAIKAMLKRSNYVICNLSIESPIAERIRQYIKKQKELTVIDLGQTPYTTEPQLL